MLRRIKSQTRFLSVALVLASLIGMSGLAWAKAPNHEVKVYHARHMVDGKPVKKTATTVPFSGAKVNHGYVTHTVDDQGRCVLTLSDDFVTPDTPAPHWQVVDSDGNVYLLNRLVIKDDKFNKSITVPVYVPDIVKVQIWCAWAEALLGEASFSEPID